MYITILQNFIEWELYGCKFNNNSKWLHWPRILKIDAVESSTYFAQLSMQLYTGATPGGMKMHNTLMVSPLQSYQAGA